MLEVEEVAALFLLWLGLVTLVGFFVVRIGLLVRRQRLAERAYRLRLALQLGRAVREGDRPENG